MRAPTWTSPPGARLAVLAGALAAAARLLSPSSSGADLEALARDLGRSSDSHVAARDIRWASSSGAARDALFGRSVLFLASANEGGPRDLWRAIVRVSPEGHPIEVVSAKNLTQTPLGDDHALVVQGDRAAYATRAYGQEQSASALDLAGEPVGSLGALDRAMAFVTNLQQTGSGAGIGRVDVGFDRPADRIGLALGERALAIDLGEGDKVRRLSLDLASAELSGEQAGARAEPARRLPKRPILWAVDTVRAVTGPAPIAWLEDHVMGAMDSLKRSLRGKTEELAETHAPPPGRVLDPSRAEDADITWPPHDLPSIWKTREKGEGVWVAHKPPWMRAAPGLASAPPFFFQTFVRPDEQRPDSKVILVAMDMRQLELGMEAGSEDPKPLTGTHGPGRLPREPEVLGRVVAAFNGAFKTEHGNYGMMVNKKVLLPPVPLAATVVTLDDGRAAMGTWGSAEAVGGLEGVRDEQILSYRQNLDPLVDEGRVNPTHRGLWGYTLPGEGTQTTRSGLCVTPAGQLLYAWGDDVSATALGKAMQTAGCAYGMHLDMNPHHTGFLFTTIRDLKARDFSSEPLTPLMQMSNDRYLNYAAKDFFYVMVRDPAPRIGALEWRADAGTQPAPAWLPALWSASHGAITLTYVDPARVRFRARAGTTEPDSKALVGSNPVYDLDEADAGRVLLAAPMGAADAKRPRALVVAGKATLGQGSDARVLFLACDARGRVTLEREMPPLAPELDVIELPLLADEGKLAPRVNGPARTRSAIGLTARGEVLLASALEPSDAPLAEALLAAGAVRVAALDRGARASGALLRAGTSAPPIARGPETTLYAIAAPMPPRAFRFKLGPSGVR